MICEMLYGYIIFMHIAMIMMENNSGRPKFDEGYLKVKNLNESAVL